MRASIVLMLVAALAGCASRLAADQAYVANPLLDELSGLAASHADPGLLWGHNDSGDGPNLFRIGLRGEDYGRVTIDGAQARDWEDIAAFDWQGMPALLIGDVGDNHARRDHLTLYAVTDPGRRGTPRLLWRLDFRYPDGARDCESIGVDPLTRRVLLLSKRDYPPRLYDLPLPAEGDLPPPAAAAPQAMQTARFLGLVETIPEPTLAALAEPLFFGLLSTWPTAMSIARDGSEAVVLTYGDAYLYRHAADESWVSSFARKPEVIGLPRLKQAEAVAISADGRRVFVSGERRPTPLIERPLPVP